jgi:dolichol-phosphate mannosyltransferase
MLDADLQDPPELILEMLEQWRGGSDVVYAVRRSRAGETRLKLVTAQWFYRIFARVTRLALTPDSGDFRLMDRRALRALLALPERNRFLRGMTVWVGFRQSAVAYDRDARFAGTTKFSMGKMIRFSLDAVSSFSHAPLQAATLLGFAFSLIAFIAIPLTIIARFTHQFVPGVSSTLIAVLLLGGIQLITVGLIGEYVGRIYDEVKRRPLYVVDERLNLDGFSADAAPARDADLPSP